MSCVIAGLSDDFSVPIRDASESPACMHNCCSCFMKTRV